MLRMTAYGRRQRLPGIVPPTAIDHLPDLSYSSTTYRARPKATVVEVTYNFLVRGLADLI